MVSLQNWLTTNATLLQTLAAVVGIAVVIWGIIRFFGTKIAILFQRLKRKIKGDPAIPNTTITFVLNSRRSLWSMGSRDNKPAMQIMASWHITNASTVPVSILGAGLITPNPRGRMCNVFVHVIERGSNWARGGDELPIKPGETEAVEATIFLDPPTHKKNEDLKLRMYFTDQYGRKHKAPKIKLRYEFPSAETY